MVSGIGVMQIAETPRVLGALNPAQMLPAVDNRTMEIKQGDRVA